MSLSRLSRVSILAPCIAVAATTALGHPGDHAHHHPETQISALLHGFTHPFTGLDHMLAMVAFGLWVATTANFMQRAAAIGTFLWIMLIGSLAGLLAPSAPFVEYAIGGSVVVMGALLATGRKYTQALGLPLAALFAVAHGHAHGAEIGPSLALGYFIGFLAASAALMGLGLALAQLAERIPAKNTTRFAGISISTIGLGIVSGII